MLFFCLTLTTIVIVIFLFFYCIHLMLTEKRKKYKIFIPIIALLISGIDLIISIYGYTDFSDIAKLERGKTTHINSIIHANPDFPFTIRYNFDGQYPDKNGFLYTSDGITVHKEDSQDNIFTIYYQIGISDGFYFPKIYIQEYQVKPGIELYPNRLDEPPEEKWIENDQKLVFSKLTINNKNGSSDIIDGNINTKLDFEHSILNHQTIVFSQSNKNHFSKIYIYQKGISSMDISIDDKHKYFCQFDQEDTKTSGLFEIYFLENISVNSNITFELYSSYDNYSISDIWFDYYITQ